MTNNIKSVLDGVRAEDALKRDTMRYLHKAMAKKTRVRVKPARFAAAFACIAILVISGLFTRLYFTQLAYLDLDVNPSIELTLNRFDKVIGIHTYNGDGDDILENLSLRHKSYSSALPLLLDAMAEHGYFRDNGLVSVTLQTDSTDKESALLADIRTGIESYLSQHHQTAKIDVFPVSRDTRDHSHEQGVSPAKYLAIIELMEVDPTATVEKCRNHSISEIKELTRGHHGKNSDADVTSSVPDESDDHNDNTGSGNSGSIKEEEHSQQQHGGGKQNGHGGGKQNGHGGGH